MSDDQILHDQISDFEQHYDYDAGWMHDLLNRSAAAFAQFDSARPMTVYHDQLPTEAHYTAAITVMQAEDCGPCLELNLKLALEAGVDRAILQTLLHQPDSLPQPLSDIRRHTLSVLNGDPPDQETATRLEAHYGAAAFAELALCIVGVRIYPTLKRALLHENHCTIGTISI